jgi:hypothetical protein
VENDDISTPWLSSRSVCDLSDFRDDTTTTNGFSIAPSIDEDGKLQTRFRLPNSTSTEPMFYTVSRTKSNTLRMEITLNTPDVPDGTFRLWIDGLRSKRIYGYCTGITTIYLSDRCHFKNRGISLRTFKYWVGECDIPYQSVLIDDVLPGVEVVVLDDVTRRPGRRLRL